MHCQPETNHYFVNAVCKRKSGQKLPQDLSQLIHDQQVLSCPKSSSSYTILPGVTLAALQSSDSTIPVICCQAHSDGAVIGYADGHVETITGPLPAAVK